MIEASKTAAVGQSVKRANDQLAASNRQTSDGFRKCQERRQKAAEDGDPTDAADAMRAFEKTRAAAHSKATAARAKLMKLRD